MTALSPPLRPRCVPCGLSPWQWEEALEQLRRPVHDRLIDRHWRTRGIPALDATARAHVGEWLALDGVRRGCASAVATDPDVVTALVGRAVRRSFWDLYVVEGHDGGDLWVRRLTDNRGFTVSWVEGRWAPPTGTTVGLRLMRLEPPGLWASTLPLVFGAGGLADDVQAALLRSFGASAASDWASFMRGPGARVILEFALAHLEEPGDGRWSSTGEPSFTEAREAAFRALEAQVMDRPDLVGRSVALPGGAAALLSAVDPTPEVMIFDDPDDLARIAAHLHRPVATLGIRGGWCRGHRVAWTDGDRRPNRAPVDLIRRDRRGISHDPTPRDEVALTQACLRLCRLSRDHRQAA